MDGTKLKKVFAEKTTDYLDGFQYENGVLQFFSTSEGYYDAIKNKYIYNYTDHLGNVRLSYTKGASGGAEIIEENNYYPFGLKHQGYNSTSLANTTYKYKYQGQELQETGLYQFKWRNYDPSIGRFLSIDPLSEEYSYQSHYTFAGNRATTYRELEGLEEYIEPFDPIEEFREGEERESPLIRQVRFNPSIPETYRATNDEPIITPESIEEKITDIEEVVVSGAKNTQGFFERAVEWIGEQLSGSDNTTKTNEKTYQTYTKTNSETEEVYSGRTSGKNTPENNVSNRDTNHHMNEKGFGEAKLDKSSPNSAAIRGREQQLINQNGGAKSTGGTSGNVINGISNKNPKKGRYIDAAKKEFENDKEK